MTPDLELSAGLVLCLETAIEGGSMALFCSGRRVQGIVGSDEMSRAESLLPCIDKLIENSGYERSQLNAVVVSTGPGSFTGIRIGLATAMGLTAALEIPCIGITAFQAISNLPGSNDVAVAVPMGRDLVATQRFRGSTAAGEPELISAIVFREIIDRASVGSVLVHHSLVEHLDLQDSGVVDAGSDLASLLYSAARLRGGVGELHPLFIDRRQFTKI